MSAPIATFNPNTWATSTNEQSTLKCATLRGNNSSNYEYNASTPSYTEPNLDKERSFIIRNKFIQPIESNHIRHNDEGDGHVFGWQFHHRKWFECV